MTKEFITGIEYDTMTDLPVMTDIFGNSHVVPRESLNKTINSERAYLQSWVRGVTWASTTSFNRIPDVLRPGQFLSMQIPNDKCFHLSFIMAAQSCIKTVTTVSTGTTKPGQGQGQGNSTTTTTTTSEANVNGVSSIGLFTSGTLKAIIPFTVEAHYVLFSPIEIAPGIFWELRYMPFDVKCDLGIIAGGPLVDRN